LHTGWTELPHDVDIWTWMFFLSRRWSGWVTLSVLHAFLYSLLTPNHPSKWSRGSNIIIGTLPNSSYCTSSHVLRNTVPLYLCDYDWHGDMTTIYRFLSGSSVVREVFAFVVVAVQFFACQEGSSSCAFNATNLYTCSPA